MSVLVLFLRPHYLVHLVTAFFRSATPRFLAPIFPFERDVQPFTILFPKPRHPSFGPTFSLSSRLDPYMTKKVFPWWIFSPNGIGSPPNCVLDQLDEVNPPPPPLLVAPFLLCSCGSQSLLPPMDRSCFVTFSAIPPPLPIMKTCVPTQFLFYFFYRK